MIVKHKIPDTQINQTDKFPNSPNNNSRNNSTSSFQINSNFTPIFNNQYSNLNTISIRTNQQSIIFLTEKFGIEPKKIVCKFCGEHIRTRTQKSTNIKAVLTAMWTLYIGFVLIQICKGKPVSCEDCVHICPNCGHEIGKYHAM